MVKYIYKITNIINNKCYIGQAKNYKQRFYTHKSNLRKNKHDNRYLQFAWNKYGEENFTFEVIDSGEDYNELEKHYINLYNSTDKNFGYNILKGGEEPPLQSGRKLTEDQVRDIQFRLVNNELIDDILSDYTFITRCQINRINNGKVWFDKNLKYPLKNVENQISNNVVSDIIYDLQKTTIKQKDIAKKYNVSRTTVTAINNGDNGHFVDGIDYPIRKSRCVGKPTDNENIVNCIIQDLMNESMTYKKLKEKYNISEASIHDINVGRGRYFRNNICYPIRKNNLYKN